MANLPVNLRDLCFLNFLLTDREQLDFKQPLALGARGGPCGSGCRLIEKVNQIPILVINTWPAGPVYSIGYLRMMFTKLLKKLSLTCKMHKMRRQRGFLSQFRGVFGR